MIFELNNCLLDKSKSFADGCRAFIVHIVHLPYVFNDHEIIYII